MLTRWLFLGIAVAIILQRLFELRLSRHNAAYIPERRFSIYKLLVM